MLAYVREGKEVHGALERRGDEGVIVAPCRPRADSAPKRAILPRPGANAAVFGRE